MEEIKELVAVVNSLPQFALWVLVLFFAYKVIFIGSIFGLIKFSIVKVSDYLMREHRILVKGFSHSVCANKAVPLLDTFLATQVKSPNLSFIHESDIQELITAWNAYKGKNNG